MTKHAEILHYLKDVPSATIDDIYKNVSFGYYCNANKHLGAVLSTMVKQRKINRIKKGVFEINKTAPSGLLPQIKIDNQTELF